MWNFLGSLLRGAFGFLGQRLVNRSLTGKEREQNAFNAQQAQNAMDFEERMANNQMVFQERMANTEWQRGVKDMQAAGLNPALAYGQGGASAMQGATASGHAASGSAQLQGLSDVLQVASFKKQMDLLDEQIRDKAKDVELKDVQIGKTEAESSLVKKQVLAFDPMNQATLNNLLQDIENKKVSARLAEANISETEARRQLELNQAFLSAIDISTRHELNTLNARLRVAEIGEAEGRIKRITAEINELYQRAILQAAQSGSLDQQTRNLAIQEGILRYDVQSKKFEVDHQKADRNWRIAGQVVSSVVGVAGAAAGIAGGYGLVSNAATNAARLSMQNVEPIQQIFAYPGSSSYGRGYFSF